MPTVTGVKAAAAAKVPGHGCHAAVYCQAASVALATTNIDNVNDIYELFWMPKGAVVVDVYMAATDMDTNAGPTLAFDLGDSGDVDRLVAASVVGQAAAQPSRQLASTGRLFKYTDNTKVTLGIQTAAATPASGTLWVMLFYVLDENYSAPT